MVRVITEVFNCVHRLRLKYVAFRGLDMFPSSGGKGKTYTIPGMRLAVSALERKTVADPAFETLWGFDLLR
jgi:hypothetical protein